MLISTTPLRLFVKCFALLAILCALPLWAQHSAPSTPFLEKNDFLLRSAGFRVKFANDELGRRALRALPPHRFVIHTREGARAYVYADPGRCNCVFTGTLDNFRNYQDILRNPRPGVDDVAPDYKTQASALLVDPDAIGLDDPNSAWLWGGF